MNLPIVLAPEHSWIRVGLMWLTLGMIIVSIWMGYLYLLVLLAVGGIVIPILWRWPLVGVFSLLLFSTQNLMFVSMDNLPFWQVAPGLRINMSDLLLVALFALSVLKLVHRGERPVFLAPMVLMAVLIAVSLVSGIVLGTTDFDTGLALARIMSTYAFYFVLVGAMDTPKRTRAVIGMVFGITLVAVAIQLLEAAMGQRLTLGLIGNIYYEQTMYYDALGGELPALWNRATEYLLVTLFLSLGCVFEGQQPKRYRLLAIVSLTGFGIALVRQWYIYIALGIFAILVLQILVGQINVIRGSATVIAGLLAIMLLAISGFAPFAAWAARAQSIIPFRLDANILGRADSLNTHLAYFKQLPLWGYGLSPMYLQLRSSDIGFSNTILAFGLAGLVAVGVLIVAMFRRAYAHWKSMSAAVERGWMLGIMGLLAAIVAGYALGVDFFTGTSGTGIWMVALVMAIVDRLSVQDEGYPVARPRIKGG